MNARIKEIRNRNGYSQEKFGKIIGVSRDTIANIEMGRIEIKDIYVTSICREFSVNEDWLRSGSGEMFKKRTRNQEIQAFANQLMESNDNAFSKRFTLALSKLTEAEWEVLEKIIDSIK